MYTLREALVVANNAVNYALQDSIPFNDDDYSLAMLEVLTHSDWNENSLSSLMGLFTGNPSCENFILLHGAMAAHQYSSNDSSRLAKYRSAIDDNILDGRHRMVALNNE